jgi:hypothetical protein
LTWYIGKIKDNGGGHVRQKLAEGSGGYQELIEAIMDPKNPQPEEMLEWVGKDFIPKLFMQKNYF